MHEQPAAVHVPCALHAGAVGKEAGRHGSHVAVLHDVDVGGRKQPCASHCALDSSGTNRAGGGGMRLGGGLGGGGLGGGLGGGGGKGDLGGGNGGGESTPTGGGFGGGSAGGGYGALGGFGAGGGGGDKSTNTLTPPAQGGPYVYLLTHTTTFKPSPSLRLLEAVHRQV